MAVAAVFAAMSVHGEKDMHPFFTRPNGIAQASEEQDALVDQSDEQLAEQGENERLQVAPAKSRRVGSKRRNVKSEALTGASKKQKTLGDVLINVGIDPTIQNVESSTDPMVSQHISNELRPTYRHAAEPDLTRTESAVIVSEDNDISWTRDGIAVSGGGKTLPTDNIPPPPPPPSGALLNGNESSEAQPAIKSTTPPKKMLRLNARGRFSSPVSVKPQEEQGKCGTEPLVRRRRGRPSKIIDQSRSLLVKLSYRRDGSNQEQLARTVSRILSGEERLPLEAVHQQKKRTLPQPKATHPFFLGKPKAEPIKQTNPSPRKASAVTPGKLRMQTFSGHAQEHEPHTNDSFGSALFKDRLMVRHPGAKDPPFPSKEQVHVRGFVDPPERQSLCSDQIQKLYGRRKNKGANLPFPEYESVVTRTMTGLVLEHESRLRPDGFRDPHPSLRVPQRRLISGEEIAQSVSGEIYTLPPNEGDALDELSASKQKGRFARQMLSRTIPTAMTAFDDGKGEALPWTHKYAPTTASEVLQPIKEMSMLRDWLKSLTVQAVSGGAAKESKAIAKIHTKPKKKRRKRNDDLDDFLVDSDEEIRDMGEIPEAGDETWTESGNSVRSVVHISQKGSKSSNLVLLSGPHGCGKTAAAHAVAKELGFRVFEINSGERRNGKDIIEKVGDMAENHLVKHHGTESAETSAAEESNRIDDAFQRDLDSGRQGKMNVFFKPQAASKPPAPKVSQPTQILKAVKAVLKTPSKEQQQSLILLEEVDVLFKEDKDFWAVVLKLIADSKRPFIMTCNDEDIVPIQAMALHAIFRFSHPPEDLAVDYMILVAAAEGHLLDRHAVGSLYRSRGFDLRASMTQLNFWCQMGIGDPRGGLGWIYQRWPPGSDVDQQGRRLRVVSVGTYQNTMGLLPDTSDLDHDRLLRWALTEYNVDPAIACGWSALHEGEDRGFERSASADSHERMIALKCFAQLADDLSMADMCCTRGLPQYAPLDTTNPDISDKARGHYVEGLRLLQTDEYVEHSHLSEQLMVNLTLLSHRVHRASNRRSSPTTEHLLPYITAEQAKRTDAPKLDRRMFACFDAIAAPEDGAPVTGPGMLQSAFDGPLNPIALDLAPYVRSIVRYDRVLEDQRDRVDQLLSDGRKAKRARTTRAARSALEGSQRENTRKERWFTKTLNYDAVLSTGGEAWIERGDEWQEGESKDGTEGASPSGASTGDANEHV